MAGADGLDGPRAATESEQRALNAGVDQYCDAIFKLCDRLYGAAFRELGPDHLATLTCHVGVSGLMNAIEGACPASRVMGIGFALGATLAQHDEVHRLVLLEALQHGMNRGMVELDIFRSTAGTA